MKEQLIEMGFKEVKHFFYYELNDGVLFVRKRDSEVSFEDYQRGELTLATNATIEQISNILKSIQI